MLLAIHVLPFILSLFCITTAFSQPSYPPLVHSLQPRNPLILPNDWTITAVGRFRLFVPVEHASTGLDVLYTYVIDVAQALHSHLPIAVAFQIGSLQLTFRADEGPLNWIMIGHFCRMMREQLKKGFTAEFEVVLTDEYFVASPIWAKRDKKDGNVLAVVKGQYDIQSLCSRPSWIHVIHYCFCIVLHG